MTSIDHFNCHLFLGAVRYGFRDTAATSLIGSPRISGYHQKFIILDGSLQFYGRPSSRRIPMLDGIRSGTCPDIGVSIDLVYTERRIGNVFGLACGSMTNPATTTWRSQDATSTRIPLHFAHRKQRNA